MKRAGFAKALLVVFGCLAVTAPDAAAGEARVRIELNKLEPNGEACRAYLVLENGTRSAFRTLKLDLVLFGTDGVIVKRLAVETAPLPAGKTSLKVFDVTAVPCTAIGRMLFNDVMACADMSGARDDCLDLIAPTARGDVPFIK